jgi:hypothetical protein
MYVDRNEQSWGGLLIRAQVILESPRQFGIADRALSNGISHKQCNGNGVIHEQIKSNGIVHKQLNSNGVKHKQVNSNGIDHKKLNGNSVTPKEVNGKNLAHREDQQSLVLFSAYSAGSLEAQIDAYRKYIEGGNVKLRDLAYTLANRREQKPHRAYAITRDISSLQVSATQVAQKTFPRVAWVFTGQGAQWPEMGAELIDTNATFRATIHKLDKFLLSLPTPPLWTIEGK